jgi:hypothetical protein
MERLPNELLIGIWRFLNVYEKIRLKRVNKRCYDISVYSIKKECPRSGFEVKKRYCFYSKCNHGQCSICMLCKDHDHPMFMFDQDELIEGEYHTIGYYKQGTINMTYLDNSWIMPTLGKKN